MVKFFKWLNNMYVEQYMEVYSKLSDADAAIANMANYRVC